MTHDEIDQLATRFFQAVETDDLATIDSLYADDVAVWHNNDGVTQNKTANLAVMQWMADNTSDRAYTQIQRAVFDGGFVQQHVLVGTNAKGQRFELPAMLRIWTSNGQITRLDEYLDSAHIAAIVGSAPPVGASAQRP
jgi:uncharacterized protein